MTEGTRAKSRRLTGAAARFGERIVSHFYGHGPAQEQRFALKALCDSELRGRYPPCQFSWNPHSRGPVAPGKASRPPSRDFTVATWNALWDYRRTYA